MDIKGDFRQNLEHLLSEQVYNGKIETGYIVGMKSVKVSIEVEWKFENLDLNKQ